MKLDTTFPVGDATPIAIPVTNQDQSISSYIISAEVKNIRDTIDNIPDVATYSALTQPEKDALFFQMIKRLRSLS